MSYGKVYEEYWDGEKIKPLSDQAALLGLYLITGPHRNAIGCFRLGRGAISDVPRFGAWGFEGVSKALTEMVETGFIVRDDDTGWTLIPNALVKDPVNSPNAARHAVALAAKVPTNTLVYKRLYEILNPQLEAYSKDLKSTSSWPLEAPSEPLRTPLPSPSPSPLPEPSPEEERADARSSDYAFEGEVIRLNHDDFAKWERAYPRLDLLAELTARDVWLANDASDDDRKRWFISTSKYLANRNAEARERGEKSAGGDRFGGIAIREVQ